MTGYYAQKFQEGLEYQDFITEKLYEAGMPLITFASKQGQYQGENKFGIEIKYDGELGKTGNVYIEYEEKSNGGNQYFVPSGILRSDNTWLYAIGDYSVLYLLSKRLLKRIFADQREKMKGFRWCRFVETETSHGMLLPQSRVETLAEKTFYFEEKKIVKVRIA